MRRPFIVCADWGVHFVKSRWKPLLKENYECEIVDNAHDALELISKYRVDALIVGSRCIAAKILMHVQTLTSETPIVLLADPCATESAVVEEDLRMDVSVKTISDMPALIEFLQNRLSSTSHSPLRTYLYRFAPVHWSFAVFVDRDGQLVRYEGATVTLGRGGMFGRTVSHLIPGESVLVEFVNFLDDGVYQAEIRCRYNDVYGFVFSDVRKPICTPRNFPRTFPVPVPAIGVLRQ